MSTTNKVILATLGAAILSVIGHIGILEWYKPDIRYELGSYYISGLKAVTYLKLKNFGHKDAEEIKITANFDEKLREVNLDTKLITLSVLQGGKNNNYISAVIPRIVPDQETYLYFEVENNSPMGANLTKDFIKEVVYKGGKGKTGVPKWDLLFVIVVSVIFAVTFFFVGDKIEKWHRLKEEKKHDVLVDEYHDYTIELIKMASEDAENKIQESEFEVKVDEYLKNIEFRKEGLKLIALKKYKLELKRNSS